VILSFEKAVKEIRHVSRRMMMVMESMDVN
jgi:hypothetical protein